MRKRTFLASTKPLVRSFSLCILLAICSIAPIRSDSAHAVYESQHATVPDQEPGADADPNAGNITPQAAVSQKSTYQIVEYTAEGNIVQKQSHSFTGLSSIIGPRFSPGGNALNLTFSSAGGICTWNASDLWIYCPTGTTSFDISWTNVFAPNIAANAINHRLIWTSTYPVDRVADFYFPESLNYQKATLEPTLQEKGHLQWAQSNAYNFDVTLTFKQKVPVVLIHGLNDTYKGWDAYKTDAFLPSIGMAESDIWPIDSLDTGGKKPFLDQIGWTTATIDENARRLSEYIAKVKQQTHARKVDIVAHSMGGLIARRYIAHYMNPLTPDVNQLIMLGTPNAGSVTAQKVITLIARSPLWPVAVVGWNYPAILELTPTYLNIWNISNQETHGVSLYAVAGNMGIACLRNPFEPIPNDIIVSVGSVFAIPLDGGWKFPNNLLGGCNGIHTGMRSPSSTQYGGGPEIFNQYVKPLLQGSHPAAAPQAMQAPLESNSEISDAVEAMQVGRVITATLQSNQSLEIPQLVESTARAVFTIVGTPSQMTVSLRDPNGQIFTPTTISPTIDYLQMDESLLPMTTYAITNPVAGNWTTIIEPNPQTPSEGVNIATAVIFNSDLRLTIPSSSDIPRIHNPMKLVAQLQANSTPLPGATLTANILDPHGMNVSVDLHDDGQQGDTAANDGVYTYEFTPNTRGPYGGAIIASGRYNGQPFQRSTAWATPVEGELVFVPNIRR